MNKVKKLFNGGDQEVQGIIRNRRRSKSTGDAGWATLIHLLSYKTEWNDTRLIKVDRFYPSAKTCTVCGYVYDTVELSDRMWVLPNGPILDQDLNNASKPILNEGFRLLSHGTSDYPFGDARQTSIRKHRSVKSEAQWFSANGAVHSVRQALET